MTSTLTYECGHCHGQGDVNQRRVGDGEIASDPCPICAGTGHCPDHDDREPACESCGTSLCDTCGEPGICDHRPELLLCTECQVTACRDCAREVNDERAFDAWREDQAVGW